MNSHKLTDATFRKLSSLSHLEQIVLLAQSITVQAAQKHPWALTEQGMYLCVLVSMLEL